MFQRIFVGAQGKQGAIVASDYGLGYGEEAWWLPGPSGDFWQGRMGNQHGLSRKKWGLI